MSEYRVESIVSGDWPQAGLPDGRWVRARPLTYWGWHRIRSAWLVLTGRCDAVWWEG